MAIGLLSGLTKALTTTTAKIGAKKFIKDRAKDAALSTARRVVGRRKTEKNKRRRGRSLAEKLMKQGKKSFIGGYIAPQGKKLFLNSKMISASTLSKADEIAAEKENSLSYFRKALNAINEVSVSILETIQSQNIKKAARDRRSRIPDRFLPEPPKQKKDTKKEKLKFLKGVRGLDDVINFFKNIFLGGVFLFAIKFLNSILGVFKKVFDVLEVLAKPFLAFLKFAVNPFKGIGNIFGGKKPTSISSPIGSEPVEGFADGGKPPVNEPVLVGEEGPELVQFGTPVNILNTTDTEKNLDNAFKLLGGLGGGGGGTNAITDKAKTKSFDKRLKDFSKFITSNVPGSELPQRSRNPRANADPNDGMDPRSVVSVAVADLEQNLEAFEEFKKGNIIYERELIPKVDESYDGLNQQTKETTKTAKKLDDPNYFIKNLKIGQLTDAISQEIEEDSQSIEVPIPPPPSSGATINQNSKPPMALTPNSPTIEINGVVMKHVLYKS